MKKLRSETFYDSQDSKSTFKSANTVLFYFFQHTSMIAHKIFKEIEMFYMLGNTNGVKCQHKELVLQCFKYFHHFWDCSDLSHCIKFLRYLLLTRACIFHELLQHSILILRIQQFWFVEASAFLWREPIMWGRFFSWPNLQMHQKQLKKFRQITYVLKLQCENLRIFLLLKYISLLHSVEISAFSVT